MELASLLPLCQERPTRRTLEEGRNLIEQASLGEAEKRDLFAIAAAVGARYVSAAMVQEVFKKEMDMIKGVSFIEEWMMEREEKGRTEEARELTKVMVAERFGDVPAGLATQIETASEDWCKSFLRRLLKAESLEELNSL